MRSADKLRQRFRSLFRRRQLEHELNSELQFHLEEQIKENIETGMTREEARRAAIRTIGNITQLKEECREKRGLRLIDELARNILYAGRALRKNTAFTCIAIVTLALGIGANTAIFSLLYSHVLKPVSYMDAERLVFLQHTITLPQGNTNTMGWSYPKFQEIVAGTTSFQALTGFVQRSVNLTDAGEPERVSGELVRANYFEVFGIKPILGRTFIAEEDDPARNLAVAVISEGLWRTKFAGDSGVIGRVVRLNRVPFTIIGITPRSFRGESGTAQIWMPVAMAPPIMNIPNRHRQRMAHWFSAVARLKPDVAAERADADLKEAVRRMEEERPSGGDGIVWSGQVVPLIETKVDPTIRRSLIVLLGAVGFVLLITCLNLSNLLLSRTLARQGEVSIRLAIGASRGALIRQFLTESLLLAVVGGLAGLIIATIALRLLALLQPSGLAGLTFEWEPAQKPAILAFNFLLSIVAGGLFGILPAIRASRIALSRTMAAARSQRFIVRKALVIAQVGLAVILLVCAGIMLKSFARLLSVDVGIRSDNVLTVRIDLPGIQYPEAEARRFFESLTTGIRSLPVVGGAAIANTLPLRGQNEITRLKIDGKEAGQVALHVIGSEYFQILGIPLIKGRFPTDADRQGSRKVAVINETAARRHFPNMDPIGHLMTFGIQDWSEPGEGAEIVGIVGDVKYQFMDSDVEVDAYVSFGQAAAHLASYLLIKTPLDVESLIPAVRAQVKTLDSLVPVYEPEPMSEVVAEATANSRFSSLLLGIFAGLALIVAAVGVYGMLAYSITQRKREIGIRMALGAERSHVARLVIQDGLVLCLIGLVLGLTGALGVTRLLRGLRYQTAPTDPATFMAVAVLLIIVAPFACWLPARRATRVDPLTALRSE